MNLSALPEHESTDVTQLEPAEAGTLGIVEFRPEAFRDDTAEMLAADNRAAQSSRRTDDSTGATALSELYRPPPDEFGLAAIQHTPTGRVRLGRQFFQRLLAVDALDTLHGEVRKWLSERAGSAYRPTSRVSESVVLNVPRWHELATWWDDHGESLPIRWRTDLSPALSRFEELADKPRTAAEDDELWSLVARCGRDWLRVPFDEPTQRFDLTADLPADAPETALNYYRELYRVLAGREWGTLMTLDYSTPEDRHNPSPQAGGPQVHELRLRPRRPDDVPSE